MAPPKSRKVAVMGYRAVGKSSLTIQFVEGQFVDSYDPTIENTFSKTLKLKGQEFVLELVDTAGQDEYSIFPQSYSMGIHGYILVYSVTSEKSFEVVKVIHEKLLDMTGQNYPTKIFVAISLFSTRPMDDWLICKKIVWVALVCVDAPVPMVLVGNKTDLHMDRVVTPEAGKNLADVWKALFVESSAKDNSSVQSIFQSMLLEIERQQNGSLEKKDDCTIL